VDLGPGAPRRRSIAGEDGSHVIEADDGGDKWPRIDPTRADEVDRAAQPG
jgi:hypothetical protein